MLMLFAQLQIDMATGFAIVGALVGAIVILVGAIRYLYNALIASYNALIAAMNTVAKAEKDEKDRVIAELTSVKKSYQEIADEAMRSLQETTNFYRKKNGEPPVAFLAPVVSESHSPSTERQREAALVQTMRAKMAAMKLASGLPPREEPERSVAPGQNPMEPQPRLKETMENAVIETVKAVVKDALVDVKEVKAITEETRIDVKEIKGMQEGK